MKQHEEIGTLIESWTRSQQQMWETWMNTLQNSASTGAKVPDVHKGMKSWQDSVNHTLDTQARAMQAWVSQLASMEGAPPESKRWAEEGAKMLEQWSTAQRGLWQQWFGMMDQAMKGSGETTGNEAFKQLMAGWEQVGKQMQDLQQAWAKTAVPDKKKKKG